MFSYLSRLLQRLDSKPINSILLWSLLVLIATVILVNFVGWLRRRRQVDPTSWWALATGSIGAVLKILVGLGVLIGLCLHLSFQSKEFARLRGGVTEQSYSAVQTIWGVPHIQGELTVRLVYYTTHYYDKDALEIDYDKLQASTQPVGHRKETIEHEIPGSAILEADHDIELWMNYRRKGGAWYPCFETNCSFTYRVVNYADREADAKFSFPLPTRQGLVDRLQVTVDGSAVGQSLVVQNEQVSWNLHMPPGQTHDVVVSYHSRGIDHLQFEPGAGRQLRKYRIRMICKGIAADEVNYPIGCMTPTHREETGGGTLLAWDLDQAVTRLGMGVIVPKMKQEGYYVARVLAGAPLGMILLIAMVVVTHLATGRAPHWLPLLLLAAAYYLYYLLMAHLADYWPGLTGGMILSGAILAGLTAVLQLTWHGRFPAIATTAFFAIFAGGYPLMRISDYEGLLLASFHVALLAYVIVIVVVLRRRLTSQEPLTE